LFVGKDSVEILNNTDRYPREDVVGAARQMLQDTEPNSVRQLSLLHCKDRGVFEKGAFLIDGRDSGMLNFPFLAAQDLSPKTAQEIGNALRSIIASAINANGDQLYLRKWNSEFIDPPLVANQRQPIVSPEQIEHAIANSPEDSAALYLLLASSGLRIGDARQIPLSSLPARQPAPPLPSLCSLCFSQLSLELAIWISGETNPVPLLERSLLESISSLPNLPLPAV